MSTDNSNKEFCLTWGQNIEHNIKLEIALKVFKYFYKEQKLLHVLAGTETERVTGIEAKIIQEAMDIVYREEQMEKTRAISETVIVKNISTSALPSSSSQSTSTITQSTSTTTTTKQTTPTSLTASALTIADRIPEEPKIIWNEITLINSKNYFPQNSIITQHGDYYISQLRQIIIKYYYVHSCPPNILELIPEIKKDKSIPQIFGTKLQSIIQQCTGFYIQKYYSRYRLVLERNNMIKWRNQYLRDLRTYRTNEHDIFYTWIKIGYSRTRLWKDIVTGLIYGIPHGRSDNQLYTTAIIHVANEKFGLIHELSQTIQIDKNSNINLDEYEKWFARLMLHTSENSVLIFGDHTPFHSKFNDYPNLEWDLEDIREWLREKSFYSLDNDYTTLLNNVHIQNQKYSKCLQMAQKTKKFVLLLPSHHHELNPIEMLWQDVKSLITQKMQRKNTIVHDTFDIISDAYSIMTTSKKWEQYLSKVKATELIYSKVGDMEENKIIIKNISKKVIGNSSNNNNSNSSNINNNQQQNNKTTIITSTQTTGQQQQPQQHTITTATASTNTIITNQQHRQQKIILNHQHQQHRIITNQQRNNNNNDNIIVFNNEFKIKKTESPDIIEVPLPESPEVIEVPLESPNVIEIPMDSPNIIEVPIEEVVNYSIEDQFQHHRQQQQQQHLEQQIKQEQQSQHQILLTGQEIAITEGPTNPVVIPEYNDLSPESIPVTIIPTKRGKQMLNQQQQTTAIEQTPPPPPLPPPKKKPTLSKRGRKPKTHPNHIINRNQQQHHQLQQQQQQQHQQFVIVKNVVDNSNQQKQQHSSIPPPPPLIQYENINGGFESQQQQQQVVLQEINENEINHQILLANNGSNAGGGGEDVNNSDNSNSNNVICQEITQLSSIGGGGGGNSSTSSGGLTINDLTSHNGILQAKPGLYQLNNEFYEIIEIDDSQKCDLSQLQNYIVLQMPTDSNTTTDNNSDGRFLAAKRTKYEEE